LTTDSQEDFDALMAAYPEIHNSKIMEIESFRADSVQQLHLQYPSIRRNHDRVEVMLQEMRPVGDRYSPACEQAHFFTYQYALAYEQGVFCFKRVL
jgi:hypothetical protein